MGQPGERRSRANVRARIRTLPRMDADATRPHPWRHRFLAHTSRAVYGTIVATAIVAGTDAAIEEWSSGDFLVTLAVTLVVLWIAEVYADVLGDMRDDPLRVRFRRAADENWPVLEPIVPLGIPLVLGVLGIIGEAASVLLMMLVAVVALGVWGGIAARQRGGTALRTAAAVVMSALIGVVIIILKTFH